MDHTPIYQQAFASIRNINPMLANRMLDLLGSEQRFFETTEAGLRAIFGRSSSIYTDDYRANLLAAARAEVEYTDYAGIRRIYYRDPEYPQRLLDCDDAPLMLYTLGRSDFNEGLFIAIVGTRHATPYGVDFVERLVADIAHKVDRPVTIVSGLAFGIDIAAHRAALKCGLPTMAVLAHGLNTMYPAAHKRDAAKMAHGAGRLVTEYTSKASPHRGYFLSRNRIIAGLCDCTVVVESAITGGAMCTAQLATDYHRDVFALPGRVSDRYSQGCNHLIAKNVAALISSADDLIKLMQWPTKGDTPQQQSLFPQLSPQEKAVIDYLTLNTDMSINRISVDLAIAIGKLSALLIDMEFKGLVLKLPGGKYRVA